ncbi:MAG: GNAT family N-acetyltransferase [Dongiaceae bacterium]
MPDGRETPQARLVGDLGEIGAARWNALAGTGNPFLRYEFLRALEESGSVGGETGWIPQHLVIEDEGGALLGAAPLYVKGHSYGEYVFDHGWAEAWQRTGHDYYPKLLSAVPFTPVPGPRILVAPGDGAAERRLGVAETLIAAARQLDVSSLHVTFVDAPGIEALEAAGYLIRRGYQFHWDNRGYKSFEDFLDTLASRKRKAIRKERRVVAEQGITIERLTGADLKAKHWDIFYALYTGTSDRKWGWPYLTRDFFHRLGAAMADDVMLVLAFRDGTPVGGALNLIGTDALYGRNWGGGETIPFVHFEACYYQAIEFAIERGIARVEAGAQGEHKIQRGYLPVETASAHWIADPGFRHAVADFLERETASVRRDIETLKTFGPYRNESEVAES